jgi:menaquinone-dependent protoporphyrinogen oxidase
MAFSIGPIGDPPKPDEEPVEVGDIVAATRARGASRLRRTPGPASGRLRWQGRGHALAVTGGDFRDWDGIDTWGARIAGEPSRASVH